MYPNPYIGDLEPVSTSLNFSVWGLVALIVGIIGGVVVYFLFINNDKTEKNKYLQAFKEFFGFKKMLIEDLLKIIYLVLAIFITLYSFEFITESFVGFIFILLIGNLVLRIIFESILVKIMIWKNTTEINKKIKK